MRRMHPLVQRNLGVSEHGANRDGVLAAAMPAEDQPRTVRLALKAALAIRSAAVRAGRARWPADAFKVGACGGFVSVMVPGMGSRALGEVFDLGGHDVSSV